MPLRPTGGAGPNGFATGQPMRARRLGCGKVHCFDRDYSERCSSWQWPIISRRPGCRFLPLLDSSANELGLNRQLTYWLAGGRRNLQLTVETPARDFRVGFGP